MLSARVLRPDLFIVGRAETEDATIKLKRAGADRVISPYQIGAAQIAQTALRPAVVDFVELATGTDNLELSMEEIGIAHRVRARRPHAARCEPSSAVRRDRRRHSARRSPYGIQPRHRQSHSRRRQAGGARAGRVAQGARTGGISLMAARILDGTAVANQIRAELRPAVEAFTARAGRPPGLGHRAGRRRSGVPCLRQQQAEVGAGEAGLRADAAAAARDGVAGRCARRRRSLEPERGARRHPRPVAAAGRDGRRRGTARVRRRATPTRTSTDFIRSTSVGSCRIGPRSSPARRRA